MGNAIRWLKLNIGGIDVSTDEDAAKTDLCLRIDSFIEERITFAGQSIANEAVKNKKIVNGDVILTFAKSSVVQKVLLNAKGKGINFRVIVVDSRPLLEGRNLARTLAEKGLEVQYTLIHALSYIIKDATKVFLGAHAMLSNGRLYSRVGTALVAMHAKEMDIPVIVCCESIKFTEKVGLDSIVSNELGK
jgi:translation initiation factor eIF-2B subunit delta